MGQPSAKGTSELTAQSVSTSGLDGRYAKALFGLAGEQDKLGTVEENLNALEQLLAESDTVRALVGSPLLSRREQISGIVTVAEKAGFEDLTRKFLGTLGQNRRLNRLSGIIRAFRQLAAQSRGEVRAEVTSAVKLSGEQVAELEKAVASQIDREVKLETRTDEGLLGGLVLQVGSRMIDTSVRTKLNALRVSMKGV